ncbi:hypothetical protein LJB87_01925 [Alistipes sp. OttesenSCG-928-L06]|nr:hypothetical protein [Alistipes sp. OttesenSCG-928-L06]
MAKEKQERTVIHLQKGDEHFYFGSLAAIYTIFDKSAIGISYGSLRNFGVSENTPYKNKYVTIRKGILKTIPNKNK